MRALIHTYTYNERSLHHMGYERHNARWICRGAQRDDSDSNEVPPVVPLPDGQIEEPADQTAQIEVEADHPEASDRPASKLGKDTLIERIALRIISVVNVEVERLIAHLREEGVRIVQMIFMARTDSRG